MYGVAIQERSPEACVAQIQAAEAAGIQAAWATMGGAGGVDMMPVFAVVAAQTERILLGNAIVHTWSRQPVAFAQETMAIEGFGPGRFRLGIGPTTGRRRRLRKPRRRSDQSSGAMTTTSMMTVTPRMI